MERKLTLKNIEELGEFSQKDSGIFLDYLIEGIKEGVEKRKKVIVVVEIELQQEGVRYDMTLQKGKWVESLQSYLEMLQELEREKTDKEIDREIEIWELLQKLK